MKGRSVEEYRAPLFIAWPLTNRCNARCITCCEESGPERAWRDELGRAAADWQRIACEDEEWQRAVAALKEHKGATGAGIARFSMPRMRW